MKKLLIALGMLISANMVNAQNGLESIIVEKYYVSNAADAAAAEADEASNDVTEKSTPTKS